MANPFAVLGLAPAVLRGLTDGEIDILVQSQYRAMSRIFHPDAGGSVEEFRKIAAAVHLLNQKSNFAEYLEYKDSYLKVRKDRIAGLDQLVQSLENDCQTLEDRLVDFWKSVVADPTDGVRVANLRSVKILIHDTMRGVVKHNFVMARPKGKVADLLSSKEEERLRFELCVDAGGNLIKYRLKTTRVRDPNDKPKGSEFWTYCDKSLWYAERIGECVPLQGLRLMACIGISEEARRSKGKEISLLFFKLLPGEVSQEHFDNLENGFSPQELKAFLPWIKPVLLPKESHYLLGGRVVGGELQCFILGSAGMFRPL